MSLSFSLPSKSRQPRQSSPSPQPNHLNQSDEPLNSDNIFGKDDDEEEGREVKSGRVVSVVTEADAKDVDDEEELPKFEFDDFGVGESAKDRIERLVRRRREIGGKVGVDEGEVFKRDVEACAEDEDGGGGVGDEDGGGGKKVVKGFGEAMLKAMGWDGKVTEPKRNVVRVGRGGLGVKAGEVEKMMERKKRARGEVGARSINGAQENGHDNGGGARENDEHLRAGRRHGEYFLDNRTQISTIPNGNRARSSPADERREVLERSRARPEKLADNKRSCSPEELDRLSRNRREYRSRYDSRSEPEYRRHRPRDPDRDRDRERYGSSRNNGSIRNVSDHHLRRARERYREDEGRSRDYREEHYDRRRLYSHRSDDDDLRYSKRTRR